MKDKRSWCAVRSRHFPASKIGTHFHGFRVSHRLMATASKIGTHFRGFRVSQRLMATGSQILVIAHRSRVRKYQHKKCQFALRIPRGFYNKAQGCGTPLPWVCGPPLCVYPNGVASESAAAIRFFAVRYCHITRTILRGVSPCPNR